MAAANTITSLEGAIKINYRNGKLVDLAYKQHPFFAMVKKNQDFGGKYIPIVPWYCGTGGQSRTFANAQANVTAEGVAEFQLKRKADFAMTTIDLEALFAAQKDPDSFLKLGTDAVERTVRQCSRNIGVSLYRNHGGARGRIAAISSGNLTLTNPGDVVNFEKGMKLQHATTDGTSGAVEAETAVLTGVNRREGILIAAAWTGFDVGNFLFRDGDFGLSSNGLASWLPATAPAPSENFLNVDRSMDTRLYGQYVDGAALGKDPVATLTYADALLAREGGAPDITLVNPLDYAVIKDMLGGKIEYDLATASDRPITFKALVLPSASTSGVQKIVSDPDCPQNEFYMLDMSTWELFTLGPAPRGMVLDEDGKGDHKFLMKSNENTVEVRTGMWGNLACWAPNNNARGSFGDIS